MEAMERLRSIPGVQNFEMLQQISKKNDFSYGLSMEFSDVAAYESYNDHPYHVSFVKERWIPEVEIFLELDYVATN